MIFAVILAAISLAYLLTLRMQRKGVMQVTVHASRPFGRESGQDLIEYALMAGFVAIVAGAIMPGVATQIQRIFASFGGGSPSPVALPSTTVMVQVACAAAAILLLALIIVRRRHDDH